MGWATIGAVGFGDGVEPTVNAGTVATVIGATCALVVGMANAPVVVVVGPLRMQLGSPSAGAIVVGVAAEGEGQSKGDPPTEEDALTRDWMGALTGPGSLTRGRPLATLGGTA